MKLYLDTVTGILSEDSNRLPLRTIGAKRGDTLEIELVPSTALTGATGLMVAKEKGAYSGAAVALDSAWTAPETEGAGYLFSLSLNTEEIAALFTGEKAEVVLMAEITWTLDGAVRSSQTFDLVVARDVWRGEEETPVAVPSMKASQPEAEAGTDNDKWMTPLRTKDAIAALGGGGGGGTSDFTLKSSGFSATAGGCYLVDTTSAALTATLPASPTLGQRILFADARGTWDTEPLTIARNGKLIDGFAVNFIAATSGMYFEIVFVDNTTGWRILAAGSKPINLTAPVMTATVLSGQWSCAPGEWTASPTNFLRQWEVSDDNDTFAPIDGATGATFSPDGSYDSKYIRCSVTAVNSNGNSTPSASNSAIAIAVANITAGSIVGGNAVGQELSLEGDTWTASGVKNYSWEKDHGGGGEQVGTDATYVPQSADIGATIVCKVRLWPSGDPASGVGSEQVTTAPTAAIEAAPFPTANLLHFWAMNSEPGDGAVADSAGAVTLSTGSGMSFVAGKIGNAVLIDGSGAFSPSSTVTLPSTAWTIALWFKISANESQNHMFAGDSGYSNLYFMEHGGGIHVSWGLATPYGGSPYLDLNTWYHVALTYDGSAAGGTGKLYINGAAYGAALTGLGLTAFNIYPGAGPSGDQPFKGTLDAYGVWDRALTLEEIGQLYSGGDGAEPL